MNVFCMHKMFNQQNENQQQTASGIDSWYNRLMVIQIGMKFSTHTNYISLLYFSSLQIIMVMILIVYVYFVFFMTIVNRKWRKTCKPYNACRRNLVSMCTFAFP